MGFLDRNYLLWVVLIVSDGICLFSIFYNYCKHLKCLSVKSIIFAYSSWSVHLAIHQWDWMWSTCHYHKCTLSFVNVKKLKQRNRLKKKVRNQQNHRHVIIFEFVSSFLILLISNFRIRTLQIAQATFWMLSHFVHSIKSVLPL